MCSPIRKDKTIPPLLMTFHHIINNKLIAQLIDDHFRIVRLDGDLLFLFVQWRSQRGESGNYVMIKRPFFRLSPGIIPVTNRAALHEYYGVTPILSGGRGGQPIDIFSSYGFEDGLEAHGRDMVTFINNDHAVVFHTLPDITHSVQ